MMKAMLWKEFRENRRRFIAGPLLLTLALGFTAWVQRAGSGNNANYSINNGAFAAVRLLAFAVAAAGLGLMQVIRENRSDKYALLVHRPMARSKIFAAKAIVGLGIYFMAGGVALMATYLWAAMPGHALGPIYPRMLLPGVADLVAGAAYYFAFMIVGMRQARWYGSRPFAGGLAVLASLLSFAVPGFASALAQIIGIVAILGVAAWGCFVSGGDDEDLPKWSRGAVSLSLAAGLMLGVVAGAVFVSEVFFRGSGSSESYSYYEIAENGSVLKVRRDNTGELEVTDLEGKASALFGTTQPTNDALNDKCVSGQELTIPRGPDPFARSFREVHNLVVPVGDGGGAWWYYSRVERRLLGYRTIDARFVGSIGPEGFVPAGAAAPARPFAQPALTASDPWNMICQADKVYRMDFSRRSIRVIFTAAPGETVLIAASGTQRVDGGYRFMHLILTDRALYALDMEGKPVLTTPVIRHAAGNSSVQVIGLKNSHWVLWYKTYGRRVTGQVEEVAADGSVVRRQDLPDLAKDLDVTQGRREAALCGTILPPLSIGLAFLEACLTEIPSGPVDEPLWWGVGTMLIAAVLAGIVNVFIARRYALGRAAVIGWGVGGLLLGLVGVPVMLGLQTLPWRKACPKCGRKRSISRETCEHCAVPWPTPATNGTEVFA